MQKKILFLVLFVTSFVGNSYGAAAAGAGDAANEIQKMQEIRVKALGLLQQIFKAWFPNPQKYPSSLNFDQKSKQKYWLSIIFKEYWPKISQEEQNLIEEAYPAPFFEYLNAVNGDYIYANKSFYKNPDRLDKDMSDFVNKKYKLKSALDKALEYEKAPNKKAFLDLFLEQLLDFPKEKQATLKKMFPSIPFDDLRPKYDELKQKQKQEEEQHNALIKKNVAIQYSPLNVYTQRLNFIKQRIESLNDSINELLDHKKFVSELSPSVQQDPQLANRNTWLKRDVPALAERLEEVAQLLKALAASLPEKP